MSKFKNLNRAIKIYNEADSVQAKEAICFAVTWLLREAEGKGQIEQALAFIDANAPDYFEFSCDFFENFESETAKEASAAK